MEKKDKNEVLKLNLLRSLYFLQLVCMTLSETSSGYYGWHARFPCFTLFNGLFLSGLLISVQLQKTREG